MVMFETISLLFYIFFSASVLLLKKFYDTNTILPKYLFYG